MAAELVLLHAENLREVELVSYMLTALFGHCSNRNGLFIISALPQNNHPGSRKQEVT